MVRPSLRIPVTMDGTMLLHIFLWADVFRKSRLSQTLVLSRLESKIFKINGWISGPKMYLATKDLSKTGSTVLHLDVTDAINILPYVHDAQIGRSSGAHWDIFSPNDSERIRKYYGTNEGQDPIHAQKFYVTPADAKAMGIRPFVIDQRAGEAVFIPAGCAHQVTCPVFTLLQTDVRMHRSAIIVVA